MTRDLMDYMVPFTVGFDEVFEKFINNQVGSTGFPPYNIIRENNVYTIQLALAGFTKEDLEITLNNRVLTIKSILEKDPEQKTLIDYLFQGISKRNFTRTFTLCDDLDITDASMVNGMLFIKLVKPDKKENIKTIRIK